MRILKKKKRNTWDWGAELQAASEKAKILIRLKPFESQGLGCRLNEMLGKPEGVGRALEPKQQGRRAPPWILAPTVEGGRGQARPSGTARDGKKLPPGLDVSQLPAPARLRPCWLAARLPRGAPRPPASCLLPPCGCTVAGACVSTWSTGH